MKEIRVWEIGVKESEPPKVTPLDSVDQTKTEKLLEDILVRRPDLLLKDLKLVGRQTDTPGGPLDLLGVDGDGQLVVFELKRGTLTREAVAQIIDYASFLSELAPEELADHIAARSGRLGIEKIDDFSAWYQEQFAEGLSRSQKPRMILVGLGADDRTRRMVSFLANSDVDISLITFHGFREGDKILLARQVEVEAKPPSGTTSVTKRDNLEILRDRVARLELDEFYYDMARFFQRHLSAYQWPNQGGYSYYLPELTDSGSESNRIYVALYLNDHRPRETKIYLHPRTIEAAPESAVILEQALGNRVEIKPAGSIEVWIRPTEEWEQLVPVFERLCAAIVEGWRKKREEQTISETQPEVDDADLKGFENS